MIDQQLIDEIASSVIHALNNKKTVSNSLCTLENVLPESACKKLWDYIQIADNWQLIEDKFYQNNRKKIVWDSDTIIEELHCAFEQATEKINQIFQSDQKQNFIGIAVWKDSEEYSIGWHTDNPLLSSALQIYLFDTCPSECGTTFKINNVDIDLPFVHNTAYLADHNMDNKLLHKTTQPTPTGIKRYSLYASWSFTEKLPG
jgi:hypothetical protein